MKQFVEKFHPSVIFIGLVITSVFYAVPQIALILSFLYVAMGAILSHFKLPDYISIFRSELAEIKASNQKDIDSYKSELESFKREFKGLENRFDSHKAQSNIKSVARF